MKAKRFSPRGLEAAVDRYFASIRRTVVATERVETGPKTFEERTILSDTGEPIRCREYVVAPTVWGLCESLGITPAQWKSLCDREEHPELQDAVQRAAGLMREWKEQALLALRMSGGGTRPWNGQRICAGDMTPTPTRYGRPTRNSTAGRGSGPCRMPWAGMPP